MARPPKIYQKLVRRRGGLAGYSSLWLAADHVLHIEANMFTERYQRVWLRDVTGLFVRPGRESRLVSLISLGFVVVLGALAAIFGGEAAIVLGVFAGLAGVVLIYGVFFARDCHFYVLTAVQRTEWTNVGRRRQARKLIARLEPLIREAQRGETTTTTAIPEPGTGAT